MESAHNNLKVPSVPAGMHVARIQNCPEAHLEQLKIKDFLQNAKFNFFCHLGSKNHIWQLLDCSLCSFSSLQCFPPPSTQWALASVPGALQNTCSMQNTLSKLNSFCFRCPAFKKHDWKHLAHFSCSSATAGMHAARIQNCLEAHAEQLRIKDCFQNT